MRDLKRIVMFGAVFGVALFSVVTSTAPVLTGGAVPATMVGFGGAVLVGDGEVFVGESANQFRPGMVYIYRKSGGSWQQAATLTGPSAAVGDRFGSALAINGDRLFVAAGADAVHVFARQGGAWTLAGTLAATAVPGTDVRFGRALAADREFVLIGRESVGGGRGRAGRGGADAPPQPAGAVYVFRRGADGAYTYASTIVSSAAERSGDNFGSAVVVSGDMALIGASGVANRAGVVFEYGLDVATNQWTEKRSFAPPSLRPGDAFGTDLALLAADQAIVSAPGSIASYGEVFVFRKVQQAGRGGGAAAGQSGGDNFTWAPVTRLAVPAASQGDRFGASLAASGQEVWVGAPGVGTAGRIFVFPQGERGFAFDAMRPLGEEGADAIAMGQSVSVRGDVAAVGATGVRGGSGGVVIYERQSAGTWVAQPMVEPALDEIDAFTGAERRCSGEGKVEMFDCGNTDLLAFLPPSNMTHNGHYVAMNDIWGWTDPRTRKEWALVGRRDGTTFVDISNPSRPVAVADLPLTDGARPSSWRDMKVYKDHTFIVSDSAGQHGMQVFDLTRLRTMKPQANGRPQRTTPDTIYKGIASAHNIVINEESGYAYSVGSSGGGETCGGGLHMIDIRAPQSPTFAGCFADSQTGRRGTGYSHDAQCVTYKGPDKRYKGHEICIGSNETAISIADVTDKKAPKAVSRATYPKVAYTHQGWLTDDHKYFYVDDEIDEIQGVPKTRTLIWDLTDLENPKLAKEHMGVEATSDHNLYIVGNLMFQANYKSGLRVLDIKNRENPREVAFFDTAPYTPNDPGYQGAWSVYPFFKSGTVIVNSIEQGLFILRVGDR